MSVQERALPTAPTRMTRKEALAVLCQLREMWIVALPYEQFLALGGRRRETSEALRTVARIVLGTPTYSQFSLPCTVCYQAWTDHIAYEREKSTSTWCCTPCRDRLRREG